MGQLLLFRLGDSSYGLEIGQIQEIVDSPVVFPIPRGPSCFAGAINVRGTVLAVLDLPSLLGYPGEGRDSRIIVLSRHLGALALSASRVQRIVPFDPQTLLPALESRSRDSCSRAVLQHQGEAVNLLDLGRVISTLEESL